MKFMGKVFLLLFLSILLHTAIMATEKPVEPEVEIRPERLAALPADLLSRLHDAAVELDRDRILALIEQIKTIDAHMARVLETSVKKFALGPLLNLLKKIERPKHGDSHD